MFVDVIVAVFFGAIGVIVLAALFGGRSSVPGSYTDGYNGGPGSSF